jgi:hypothetical protein
MPNYSPTIFKNTSGIPLYTIFDISTVKQSNLQWAPPRPGRRQTVFRELTKLLRRNVVAHYFADTTAAFACLHLQLAGSL